MIYFFKPTNFFYLPTNLTNLHESCSMNKMATCSVARIFTNSIFSATLGNIAVFSVIRVIRATEQVAINTEDM